MTEKYLCGGCFCGKIRYELAAPPVGATICYCPDCRRAAGSQSVAWYTVPANAFSITRGTPVEYASSPGVVRTFCGTCGTSLGYTNSKRPAEIDITTASLDDPGGVPPEGLVFTSRKLPWDITPDLPTIFDQPAEP